MWWPWVFFSPQTSHGSLLIFPLLTAWLSILRALIFTACNFAIFAAYTFPFSLSRHLLLFRKICLRLAWYLSCQCLAYQRLLYTLCRSFLVMQTVYQQIKLFQRPTNLSCEVLIKVLVNFLPSLDIVHQPLTSASG